MTLRLDRCVTGLVFATWVVMTAHACLFVSRHGYNLPRLDEWEFVPMLFGNENSVRWAFARHNEHRFPLARLVYLGLHMATGHDFRAGMWLTVALLSACAAILGLAARQLRGCSALIDLSFPVLLLNVGQAENLTMGYQITFTLTVAFVTLFLAAVAWSDRLGGRGVAVLCGVATLGVALGGGIGWAFAPALGAFTLWRVAAASRQSRHPARVAACLAAAPVLAGLYVLGSVVELRLGGGTRPPNDFATVVRVAFEFWTVSLGGAGQVGYPLPGLVAIGCVAEALLYAAGALAGRQPERQPVLAAAAVIVGAVVLSVVIGVTRPLGNESRYAAFGGLALCAAVVARARPGPRGPLAAPGVLLIPAFAAAVAWQDWRVGRDFVETHEVRTAMLNRDVRLGLPANALAERHVLFPVAAYAHAFEVLYASGHKSLRGAGPPRAFRVVPIPLPADAVLPAFDGVDPAPVWQLALPGPMTMDALRLEVECPDARYREVYRLELPATPDESAGVTSVWLTPGLRTVLFRVEGTLDRIVVRPVERTAGLKVTRCEAITFE